MRPDGDGRFCERCQLRVTEVAKPDSLEQLAAAAARSRTCVRLAAGLLVVALAGCATPMPESSNPPLEMAVRVAGSGGAINGMIKHSEQGYPAAGAIVVLQSTALPSHFEVMTDERGIYSFEGLPPGNYTIQVLYGKANSSKIVQLPTDARFRANFSLDPEQDHIVGLLVVEEPMIDHDSASSTYSSRMLEYD
jgi:hypothetical protein